jgi:NADH:ubiquinone reductase (H+-translocating)
VVIAGAGFAGFNAARELSRLVGKTTEIVVINSTDYFLYLPLMPQVAGGLIEPRHIRVSLPRLLRKMRFVLGTVNHVDHGQSVNARPTARVSRRAGRSARSAKSVTVGGSRTGSL